jgi:hypothetical protein
MHDEFYTFEGIESECEDGIISGAEEGFMQGYLSA